MNGQFPVDIYAAKEYGIEKWQKEFFWPVSDMDFADIYKSVEKCFKDRIKTADPEISGLLLLQADLRFEYLSFIHAFKVAEEVRKRNMALMYSDNSLWYKDIATDKPNYISLARDLKEENMFASIKSGLLKMTKTVICNTSPSKVFAGITRDKAYIYNTASDIMKDYMSKTRQFFFFTSNSDWFSGYRFYELPAGLKSNIRTLAVSITNEICKIAAEKGVNIPAGHADYLGKSTEAALINGARMAHSARGNVRGKKKTEVLISSLGNSLLRAVAFAAKEEGAKVISFSHGGHIGLHYTPTMAFSEFAFSDEFITYTKKSVENFEKIKSAYSLSGLNSTRIRSGDSDEFMKYRQKYGKKPLPEQIKRVMIIGYPHNLWRKPQAPASLSLMHLDFEMRLVDSLNEAGYEIIYKAHPHRARQIEGIFNKKAKVMSGYLEDCLDEADAYIFGAIRTTAFPLTLCTNKPVISFIMKNEPYEPLPEAMGLLKKRCDVIYTDFDERNRIVFNGNTLLDALSKPVKEPDNEFIETYYLP